MRDNGSKQNMRCAGWNIWVVVLVLGALLTATLAPIACFLGELSGQERNVIPLVYGEIREAVGMDGLSYFRAGESTGSAQGGQGAWQIEADVDLFKAAYINDQGQVTVKSAAGDKVIAPGTFCEYEFKLQYADAEPLKYIMHLSSGTSPERELLMQVRLRSGDRWILGGDNTWVPHGDLSRVEEADTVSGSGNIIYTLEWKWPYESGTAEADAKDTKVGNEAEKFELKIEVLTQLDNGSDPPVDPVDPDPPEKPDPPVDPVNPDPPDKPKPPVDPGPEPPDDPPDEPAPKPTATPTPTPTPTATPTPTPTPEPTPTLTSEPTAKPIPEPTAKPVIGPIIEPTAKPTPEPSPEPAPEPSPEPTPGPIGEPEPQSSWDFLPWLLLGLLGILLLLLLFWRKPVYVTGFLPGEGELSLGRKKDDLRPNGRFVFPKVYMGKRELTLDQAQYRIRLKRKRKWNGEELLGIAFAREDDLLVIYIGKKVKAIELYLLPDLTVRQDDWAAIDKDHNVITPEGVKEPDENEENTTPGGLHIDEGGDLDVDEFAAVK